MVDAPVQSTAPLHAAPAPIAEGEPKDAKAPRNRRRRSEKPKAEAVAASGVEASAAIIDAAIPHPSEHLHRHEILETSTALPVAALPALAEIAEAPAPRQQQRRERNRPAQKPAEPALTPVQPHENRHQRRAAGKPQQEEDADLVAGHGFGDHLPAFLRRPVRLPAGDRNTGK